MDLSDVIHCSFVQLVKRWLKCQSIAMMPGVRTCAFTSLPIRRPSCSSFRKHVFGIDALLRMNQKPSINSVIAINPSVSAMEPFTLEDDYWCSSIMAEQWDYLGFENVETVSTWEPKVTEVVEEEEVGSPPIDPLYFHDHEIQDLLAEEDAQTAVDLVTGDETVSAIANITGMSSAGVKEAPRRKTTRYGDDNVAGAIT